MSSQQLALRGLSFKSAKSTSNAVTVDVKEDVKVQEDEEEEEESDVEAVEPSDVRDKLHYTIETDVFVIKCIAAVFAILYFALALATALMSYLKSGVYFPMLSSYPTVDNTSIFTFIAGIQSGGTFLPATLVFIYFIISAVALLCLFALCEVLPEIVLSWIYRRVNYVVWAEFIFTQAFMKMLLAERAGQLSWDQMVLQMFLAASVASTYLLTDFVNDPQWQPQSNSIPTSIIRKISYMHATTSRMLPFWLGFFPWAIYYVIVLVFLGQYITQVPSYVLIALFGLLVQEMIFGFLYYLSYKQLSGFVTNYRSTLVLFISLMFAMRVWVGFALVGGDIAVTV
jgi:hypothetical protein